MILWTVLIQVEVLRSVTDNVQINVTDRDTTSNTRLLWAYPPSLEDLQGAFRDINVLLFTRFHDKWSKNSSLRRPKV